MMLATVAGNLVSNAISYTDQGSVRLIECEEGFRVEDTGIGIDESELEQIFAAFARGARAPSRSAQGVGLGLSIVQRICERCGWRVTVRRAAQQGTVFCVELAGSGAQRADVRER